MGIEAEAHKDTTIPYEQELVAKYHLSGPMLFDLIHPVWLQHGGGAHGLFEWGWKNPELVTAALVARKLRGE